MMLTILPLHGLPEVHAGDDLAAMITAATVLHDGDVIVVAQKIVSKAEGRVLDLATVEVSDRAVELGRQLGRDPRFVEAVLAETVRIVRAERVLISETRHGFVCANAGVDRSNSGKPDSVTLLPLDCDASAERLRRSIEDRTGVATGVVISDTFGRPWRMGICNVALGVAGITPLLDHRGRLDDDRNLLESTVVAVADEIAAAAELVMGKTERVPVAIVRGLSSGIRGNGAGCDLVRPASLDLFR